MKILIAVMVLAFVAACTGTANVDHAVNLAPAAKSPTDGTYVPTPRPDDGAPRITLADAKKDFDAKTALFIDTRSAEQYAQGHVPGSINLSVSDLAAGKEDKLSKGKKIIAYCS